MVVVGQRSPLHLAGWITYGLVVIEVCRLDMMGMFRLFRMQHRRRMPIANRKRHNNQKFQEHLRHRCALAVAALRHNFTVRQVGLQAPRDLHSRRSRRRFT